MTPGRFSTIKAVRDQPTPARIIRASKRFNEDVLLNIFLFFHCFVHDADTYFILSFRATQIRCREVPPRRLFRVGNSAVADTDAEY